MKLIRFLIILISAYTIYSSSTQTNTYSKSKLSFKSNVKSNSILDFFDGLFMEKYKIKNIDKDGIQISQIIENNVGSENLVKTNYSDGKNTNFLERNQPKNIQSLFKKEINIKGDLNKFRKVYKKNFIQKNIKIGKSDETPNAIINSSNSVDLLNVQTLPSKIVLPKKNDIRLILEDWMKISSPSFKSFKKFPPILLPDGTQTTFKIDDSNFRVNNAFDVNDVDPNLPPEKQFFWFRLSERNMFYSLTKSDMNILGAIPIATLINVQHSSDFSSDSNCIIIDDREAHEWKICAESIDIRNKWYCTIKEILNQSDIICEENSDLDKPTVIEKVVTQPIILIPLPSRNCNDDWNYQLKGDDWECECSEGKEQSPIDLPPEEKAIPSPVKPLFQYEETLIKLPYSTIDGLIKKDENVKIQYLDNCLRIFHKYFGKIVTLDGAVYNAEELVFHSPAEHTINGKKYDLELQVVHYGQTRGDISKQIVLTFLFEKKPGVFNKFIDDIDFFNLPNPITKESDLKNNLFIPKVFYTADNNNIPVMKPFSFYTYQGSLTSPPCNERTIVYVASQPIPLSSAAIQMFEESLRIPDLMADSGDVISTNKTDQNSRKLQDVNGRPIFFYDHIKYCIPEPIIIPPKPRGHYEKIHKETTEYFYVNGEEPSGLPGSYVVPEDEATKNLDAKK